MTIELIKQLGKNLPAFTQAPDNLLLILDAYSRKDQIKMNWNLQ